jgi:hypothetical protein
MGVLKLLDPSLFVSGRIVMSNDESRAAPNLFIDQDFQTVSTRFFYVRGAGGAQNSFIYLYEAGSNEYLGKGSMFNNPFSVRLHVYPGKNTIRLYAKWQTHAEESGPSNIITLRFLTPKIDARFGNPPIDIRHTFSGQGLSGSRVTLYSISADGSPQMPALGAATTTNERWQIQPDLPLPPGPLKLVAIAVVGTLEAKSDVVDFVVAPAFAVPVITHPAAGSVQDRSFMIEGSGSVANATVVILRDLGDNTPLGSATATGDRWSVNVAALPPGPISIVAEQILNEERSGRSSARFFKIRAAPLSQVEVTRLSSTTVRFSGTGHYDPRLETRIEISAVAGDVEAPPLTTVKADGTWDTIGNVPFGRFSMTATQRVADNANGWIDSLLYNFSFNHEFPKPLVSAVSKEYRPTFSGTGLIGATVRLYDTNQQTSIAPDVRLTSETWSSRALAEWGPTYERRIYVKQVLNGLDSGWVWFLVTIPPLAPIVQPPVEADQSPHISGTCWPGAAVTLEYNNDGVKHRPTVTGGTWTFRREAPFAVGVTHTFSVTQTFASQTSVPATGSFTVRRAMLKPGITVPAEGAEVSRNTTVSGELGMEGATMRVWDEQYETMLNCKTLTSDGDWSIELTDLRYGELSLTAQQTLENDISQRSEIRVCHVVLKPPVLLVPGEGGHLPRQSTVSGTGWPGARVTAWLVGVDEPLLREVLVSASGQWSGQVTLPQVGYYKMRLQQTSDSETSKDLLCDFQVVPSSPVIESPTQSAAIGGAVVVSGFGFPGDTVTVKLSTGTTLGSVQVLEDRTWSLSACIDHSGGPSALTVQASCGEFVSAVSDPRPVQINTWLPHIEDPSAGRWVAAPVTFAGTGKAGVGQVVSWFNPDVVWAAELAVSNGQWQGAAAQVLAPGGNWCRFRQTFAAGADPASASDWAESQRFEVLISELKALETR